MGTPSREDRKLTRQANDGELCACGLPLHYADPVIAKGMANLVRQKGPDVRVINDAGRAFMVPRHYIALHGFKEVEIVEIAQRYGFKEVTE